MKTTKRIYYSVIGKVKETPQTTTLILEPKPVFIPGQYITIYFPNLGTPEGKPYSISSSPSEKYFSITIKAMGEFSNRLCSLKVGDRIEASQPYGFFFSESKDNDAVLLASGIGVAAFRSMILSNSMKKIILHYSVKKKEDMLFKEVLKKIYTTHYFTQEGSARINPQEIVSNLPALNSPEFFICGSIAFVRDMWRGLRDAGVPEETIFTEAFF